MKNDKIKKAQQAMLEEDYNEVKHKINDLKGFEQDFKEAAKDVLSDAVSFYISLVEETMRRHGYTEKTIHNVCRKSFKNNIDNSFLELFYTKDDRLIAVGSIKMDDKGIRIEVKSNVYKEPIVQAIKFE